MTFCKQTLISLLLGLCFSSCATIFNGSMQNVTFTSDPPNAQIYINGENTYEVTPATLKVPRKVAKSFYNRKNEQFYEFKKHGYHSFEYRDYRTQPAVFLWSVLNMTTYSLGFWVDLYKQSWNKYDKHVHVKLAPKQVAQEQKVVYVEKKEQNSYQFRRLSDVDQNIPLSEKTYDYRFALIIGNEDYQSHQLSQVSEANVRFARNDASAFREYASKTLGIPERNIIFLLDATSGKMQQALTKLSLLAKNSGGKAELFFYFAGHGAVGQEAQKPYLLPVDANSNDLSPALQLSKLYARLTAYPSQRVSVFLDACFTGGSRGSQLMAVRGVGIKPKQQPLKGNLVVFSATQPEQSALVHEEQRHGLFTYYLLKKLQQEQPLTYEQWALYIESKVGLESVLLSNKEQLPLILVSQQVNEKWKAWQVK